MMQLRATELAAALGVSKGRISQLVSEGRLVGCFTGDGHSRRFDLKKAAQALDRQLDASQSVANGTAALAARRAVLADTPTALTNDPVARLAAARAENAELDARKKRREEALASGRYLLAEEVARAQAAAVARLLDAVERHHLDAVRGMAAEAGRDARTAVAEARTAFRAFRARHAAAETTLADAATHTPAEQAELALTG